MHFGIPGTNIGFDLDIPDPAQEAQKMMNKVTNLMNDVTNHMFSFFKDFMAKIGTGFKSLVTTVPNQAFNALKDGIIALWNALTGRTV